jgi:hypothetical protein
MTRKTLLILTVAVCGLFSHVGSSQAALIIIEITAEVTDVTDPHRILEGKINLSDTITGRYTYDTSAPDSYPTDWLGIYWYYDPPYGIWLTVNGLELKSNPDDTYFTLGIGDNAPPGLHGGGGLRDWYGVGSLTNLLLKNGAIVSDIVVSRISLGLGDSSCNAISSDVLPETAPVLNDWEVSSITVSGYYPGPEGGSFEVKGYLTSAVLIPEPGTLMLLGICTVGLLRMRRCPESDRKERNRW